MTRNKVRGSLAEKERSLMSAKGITGGFDYNRRVEYIIPPSEVSAGRFVRYIEVSANAMFGMQPEADHADVSIYDFAFQCQSIR